MDHVSTRCRTLVSVRIDMLTYCQGKHQITQFFTTKKVYGPMEVKDQLKTFEDPEIANN